MHKLFTLSLLAVLPMVLSSQTVNLHAGTIPIEQQMTDEQRQTVTHLTVTGTLTDEDYAFIRTSLLKQLKELNLKEADIDTIPASALSLTDWRNEYNRITVVLPRKLKHLQPYSLWITRQCRYEVTGYFPSLENDVFYHGEYGWINGDCADLFYVSHDNPNCVQLENSGIYSQDMDTLYFGSHNPSYLAECKVIAGHAYEEHYMLDLAIPATVDSIGDCAFRNTHWAAITREYGTDADLFLLNRSLEPQKLGKNVFKTVFDWQRILCEVYPEALPAYKSAEGWNKLDLVPFRDQGIQTTGPDRPAIFSYTRNVLSIHSSKRIIRATIYDLSGNIIYGDSVDKTTLEISLGNVNESILIVRIVFEDRTYNTYKIKR